jgi:hypothetical protein
MIMASGKDADDFFRSHRENWKALGKEGEDLVAKRNALDVAVY